VPLVGSSQMSSSAPPSGRTMQPRRFRGRWLRAAGLGWLLVVSVVIDPGHSLVKRPRFRPFRYGVRLSVKGA
jgi:hypothetical protein